MDSVLPVIFDNHLRKEWGDQRDICLNNPLSLICRQTGHTSFHTQQNCLFPCWRVAIFPATQCTDSLKQRNLSYSQMWTVRRHWFMVINLRVSSGNTKANTPKDWLFRAVLTKAASSCILNANVRKITRANCIPQPDSWLTSRYPKSIKRESLEHKSLQHFELLPVTG